MVKDSRGSEGRMSASTQTASTGCVQHQIHRFFRLLCNVDVHSSSRLPRIVWIRDPTRHPSRFLPSALSTTFGMDFRYEGPLSRPRAWRANAIFSCSHLASCLPSQRRNSLRGEGGTKNRSDTVWRAAKGLFFFSRQRFFSLARVVTWTCACGKRSTHTCMEEKK